MILIESTWTSSARKTCACLTVPDQVLFVTVTSVPPNLGRVHARRLRSRFRRFLLLVHSLRDPVQPHPRPRRCASLAGTPCLVGAGVRRAAPVFSSPSSLRSPPPHQAASGGSPGSWRAESSLSLPSPAPARATTPANLRASSVAVAAGVLGLRRSPRRPRPRAQVLRRPPPRPRRRRGGFLSRSLLLFDVMVHRCEKQHASPPATPHTPPPATPAHLRR